MSGLCSLKRSVKLPNRETLDECPMAYKGMENILDNIGPTADVVRIIRPIYNFKAGDTG